MNSRNANESKPFLSAFFCSHDSDSNRFVINFHPHQVSRASVVSLLSTVFLGATRWRNLANEIVHQPSADTVQLQQNQSSQSSCQVMPSVKITRSFSSRSFFSSCSALCRSRRSSLNSCCSCCTCGSRQMGCLSGKALHLAAKVRVLYPTGAAKKKYDQTG